MSGGTGPTETFGPYLVYEELGVGGMAQVHRAETSGLAGFKRQVALKRMLPHLARDEDFVRSFVREARLASHLRHNNVAQTYELGKVGDIYFIAMELVTGPDLRQVLRHCLQTTGPMPVSVTLNVLGQLCDALDYAHNLADDSGQQLGIIHRDVSPSNIIVSDGGVVKLIDFGIAKASAAGMQTSSGAIKGKFGYMAPEYVEGVIDSRADLFAIGVIGHELLTNKPLFSGRDDLETLNNLRAMEVPPPSRDNRRVPSAVDAVVLTALERDPDRRWNQASAMRSALTAVAKQLDLVATNQQVSDWLGWAFMQPIPPGAGEVDQFAGDDTDDDHQFHFAPSQVSLQVDPSVEPDVIAHGSIRPQTAAPGDDDATDDGYDDSGPIPPPDAAATVLARRQSGLVIEPLAGQSSAPTELGVAPAWQATERVSTSSPVVPMAGDPAAEPRRTGSRRAIVIAAAVIVTLGLAAAVYFIMYSLT